MAPPPPVPDGAYYGGAMAYYAAPPPPGWGWSMPDYNPSISLAPPPGMPDRYACKRCGAFREHFVKDCPLNVCARCGESGHIATTCKARSRSDGQPIVPPSNYVCRRCGAIRQHFIRDCPTNVCNRCGQAGHIAPHCTVERFAAGNYSSVPAVLPDPVSGPTSTAPATVAVAGLPEPVSTLPAPASSLPEPVSTLPAPASSLPEPVSTLPAPASSLPEPVSTLLASGVRATPTWEPPELGAVPLLKATKDAPAVESAALDAVTALLASRKQELHAAAAQAPATEGSGEGSGHP